MKPRLAYFRQFFQVHAIEEVETGDKQGCTEKITNVGKTNISKRRKADYIIFILVPTAGVKLLKKNYDFIDFKAQ